MAKLKKYCLVVEYEDQDGRIKEMKSKPLTKRQKDKEQSRLGLMGHSVRVYDA